MRRQWSPRATGCRTCGSSMRSCRPRAPVAWCRRCDSRHRSDRTVKKFLMLHGVNHNMFGKREPKYYGTITLAEIDARLGEVARELGVEVSSFQTNMEGEMCERIHRAIGEGFAGV